MIGLPQGTWNRGSHRRCARRATSIRRRRRRCSVWAAHARDVRSCTISYDIWPPRYRTLDESAIDIAISCNRYDHYKQCYIFAFLFHKSKYKWLPKSIWLFHVLCVLKFCKNLCTSFSVILVTYWQNDWICSSAGSEWVWFCVPLDAKWLILCSTWCKMAHFRDVLPSQCLGTILKKPNLTEQRQTFTS